MQTTIQFLEALKEKYNLKSTYAVAKFLGQTETSARRWANGSGSFSDDTAMHVADLLDLDPAYVVACIHAERAKEAKEKKLWERIANLSIGVTAALLVVWMLPIVGVSGGDSSIIAMAGMTFPEAGGWSSVYYVKWLADYGWVFLALFLALLLALPRQNRPHQKRQDKLSGM